MCATRLAGLTVGPLRGKKTAPGGVMEHVEKPKLEPFQKGMMAVIMVLAIVAFALSCALFVERAQWRPEAKPIPLAPLALKANGEKMHEPAANRS